MEHDKKSRQWMLNGIFILMSAACILPFILLVMTSITDEQTIIRNGYSFFPAHFSRKAYEYLFQGSNSIFRAYGVSAFVTVAGTTIGLLLTTLLAYPLSRKDMPLRTGLSFYVFFTILFNGGLVPTYLVYTQWFDVKNTLLALIVPNLLLTGFYVLLARTFFQNTIPPEIIESAYMDGAGEFRIFFRMIVPLSKPVLATVGLFQLIRYWNDWFNGLIFITDQDLYGLQYLLNKILLDIQYLAASDMGGRQGDALSALPKESVRMAMAVVGVIPIMVAYPFFQRFFVQGLTVGAVKG